MTYTAGMNIYEELDRHGIPYEKFDHEPVMNMEESAVHCAHIPGAPSANLFLKGKRTRQCVLLVLAGHKRANWKVLKQLLGEEVTLNRDEAEMETLLGCSPGSVSLLGLINDTAKAVRVLIDRELWNSETLHYHPPGDNTATLVIKRKDLNRFIRELGYEISFVDLPASRPDPS